MDISSPLRLKADLPLTNEAEAAISRHRQTIQKLITGEDQRHLVIVGPCSLHDDMSAEEFCAKLALLRDQTEDSLFFVMRAYVEKARTSTGWKGLATDPHLDGSFAVEEGLRHIRKLLLRLNSYGIPLATEFIDPFVAPYYQDLISWGCIGARTSSSQLHRQLASHLPMPIGFKNSVEGDLTSAIFGMVSARHPHAMFTLSDEGTAAATLSSGNPHTHLVLRGSKEGPNYTHEKRDSAEQLLMEYQLPQRILIDCSHDNSGKNHLKQVDVARSLAGLPKSSFLGIMLESHIKAGQQPLRKNELSYGISITDACLGWEETESAIIEFAETVAYMS